MAHVISPPVGDSQNVPMPPTSNAHIAWLPVLAAFVTIGLKFAAYGWTGSVGLLSDALESFVNLVTAGVALLTLRVANKPPDEDHVYGHTKAEYFASILEGGLIVVAALSIGYAAIERWFHPQSIRHAALGLAATAVATLINALVARRLLRASREIESITLEAGARHLMTDVWTSVGVVAGVALVVLTDQKWLDPALGLAVAGGIVYTGWRLIQRSALGFMDTAIAASERDRIHAILRQHLQGGLRYHALRTRQAGRRRFITVQILVPGAWTVQQGHDLAERIEAEIRAAIPASTVTTHLEPLEDDRSYADISIDR